MPAHLFRVPFPRNGSRRRGLTLHDVDWAGEIERAAASRLARTVLTSEEGAATLLEFISESDDAHIWRGSATLCH
jgi:hypothetical protein